MLILSPSLLVSQVNSFMVFLMQIFINFSLWSSGQSSWLQIQRSRVRFLVPPIFWEVVALERGPLNLVDITEELLEWQSSGSGSRKLRLTAMGICCTDHVTPLCPQKLAPTSPTSSGRSFSIVCLWTKAMEFFPPIPSGIYILCIQRPTNFRQI
jgi:hypothetical protein